VNFNFNLEATSDGEAVEEADVSNTTWYNRREISPSR